MGSKKRRRTGIEKDFTNIAVAGVGLGIAGGIAGAAGAPAGVATAIGSTARFLPLVAGLSVLKHTKKTFKNNRRRLY